MDTTILEELILQWRRFPGVGRRTAERYAYALLEWPEEDLRILGQLIAELRQKTVFCPVCGALAPAADRCLYCHDPRRDRTTLCVLEHFSQIPLVEKSGSYRGLYHVLGGCLRPLEGKGPEALRMAPLLERLGQGEITEVILALNPDVEGEATAAYLSGELLAFGVRITRIASGVPAGADLAYADAAMMGLAISRRQAF